MSNWARRVQNWARRVQKKIFFEAKHTKDSKDFACSTLSLCHLSRAFFLSENFFLGLGHLLKNGRFGHAVSKIGHAVSKMTLDTKPPADAQNVSLFKKNVSKCLKMSRFFA